MKFKIFIFVATLFSLRAIAQTNPSSANIRDIPDGLYRTGCYRMQYGGNGPSPFIINSMHKEALLHGNEIQIVTRSYYDLDCRRLFSTELLEGQIAVNEGKKIANFSRSTVARPTIETEKLQKMSRLPVLLDRKDVSTLLLSSAPRIENLAYYDITNRSEYTKGWITLSTAGPYKYDGEPKSFFNLSIKAYDSLDETQFVIQ